MGLQVDRDGAVLVFQVRIEPTTLRIHGVPFRISWKRELRLLHQRRCIQHTNGLFAGRRHPHFLCGCDIGDAVRPRFEVRTPDARQRTRVKRTDLRAAAIPNIHDATANTDAGGPQHARAAPRLHLRGGQVWNLAHLAGSHVDDVHRAGAPTGHPQAVCRRVERNVVHGHIARTVIRQRQRADGVVARSAGVLRFR